MNLVGILRYNNAMVLPKSLELLIEHFQSLPGIGPKTAERLAFYFLKSNKEKAKSFALALKSVSEDLRLCSNCHNVSESDLCAICQDSLRRQDLLCVVENPLNLIAIERTGYSGLYHVLHGVLNPLKGVGINDLYLDTLVTRVKKLYKKNPNLELILATNPTMEGESTAMYIKRILINEGLTNLKITRIGRGLPTGGDMEYADKSTLDNALQGRVEF